jgi:hypothetical protein
MEKITLRGHHLLGLEKYLRGLTVYEQRKKAETEAGYSKEFIEETEKIFSRIVNEEIEIILTTRLDDLCKKCNKQNSLCDINGGGYDLACIDIYGFEEGRIYRNKEIVREIVKIISTGRYHKNNHASITL